MLIENVNTAVFNKTEIFKGSVICAKHISWSSEITGIVSEVTDNKITVIFLKTLTCTQNHFFIHINDLKNGKWDIRYSTDGLKTVKTYSQDQSEQGGISCL